jgi:hypothetical protein
MQLIKIMLVCFVLFAFDVSSAESGVWKQKDIIITFWSPPPVSKGVLSAVAKEGFNLTWTYEYGLDAVHSQGLMVMLQDDLLAPIALDNPQKRIKLDALINRVKDHPSLAAYHLADEPNAADFPGLGRLVAYLRERDPNHFAYINLFPIYASNKQLGTSGPPVQAYQEYLRRFIEEVKPSFISYDHYHFFKTGDGEQYFLNLELIRRAAGENSLPFLNIIQASTIEKSWRLVNPNELRWLVYTTLAYGGRGISYFLYWGPLAYGGLYQGGVRTPLVDTVTVLNKEMSALSTSLMDLDNLEVYNTDPLPTGTKPVPPSSPVQFAGRGAFVLGLFGRNKTVTTFMVVNRDYKTQATTQLYLRPEVRGIEEFDRASRQWKAYQVIATGRAISVTLSPGDGRLFRFVP